MKQQTITLNILEEGDYVRTPRGAGVIVEVDVSIEFKELYYQVVVQHKFDSSDNPDNEPESMSGWTPILISKEEYDNETD